MSLCSVLLAVVPVVTPLTVTNELAQSDDLVGTVIIVPDGTVNLVVEARVTALPCPDVQWSFNGVNISNEDPTYSVRQPCDSSFLTRTEHLFALTIANVTRATLGDYSAVFSNFFGSGLLPRLVVTNPGMLGLKLRIHLSV